MLAVLAAPCLAAAAEAKPPDARQDGGLSVAETQRRLAKRVDVDLPAGPLRTNLEHLARQVPGVDIVFHPDVSGETRNLVRPAGGLTATRIPAQGVLTLLCGPDLAWVVEPGRARVIGLGTYHRIVSVQRHEVSDLAATYRPRWFHRNREGHDVLRDLVQRFVNHQDHRWVTAWADEGGPATITWRGDGLVIAQTPRGHAHVARLLAVLRRAQGRDVPPPAPPAPVREALAQTRRLLAEPIDLDFRQVPLRKVLDYLREVRPRLNLVVADRSDWPGQTDPTTRRVTLSARGVPLGTALDAILGEGLGYRVEPGYVAIRPRERTWTALSPAAHAIGDLSSDGTGYLQPEALLDLVKRIANHEADRRIAPWADEGGPATAESFAGALLVQQTEEGQRRIAALVPALRTAIVLAGEQTARGPVPPVALPAPAAQVQTSRALAARIDADFEAVPLEKVLDVLTAGDPPLNLVVHPDVYDYSRLEPTTPVTLKRRGTTRGEVLKEVFGKTHALHACAGYVRVRKTDRPDDTPWVPLETVLYPVADLAHLTPEALVTAIRQAVRHDADPAVAVWAYEEGRALLEYCDRVLVVTQTRHGQKRVRATLRDLRRRDRGARALP